MRPGLVDGWAACPVLFNKSRTSIRTTSSPNHPRPPPPPPRPDGRLAYVEFRIGDYQAELGLVDRGWAPPGEATGPGGAIMYWHVEDVAATFEKLLAMGATEYQPITPREEGFVTAAVVDPFGNVLALCTTRTT